MDIQPNENLIIALPSVKIGSEKEKVFISNIDKQYVCLQLEISKNQFKSVYLELKTEYSINATKDNETIRLKRIKLSNLSDSESEVFRKDKDKQESVKFIKLLQKSAGVRFRYFIPIRFMVKIYNVMDQIENETYSKDHYRKVFFREAMFKVQLIGEKLEIWFYDLDSFEFDPINEEFNCKRIVTIDSITKNVKEIFDDVSKEIGYWVILEKSLEAGLKICSMFKRKGKVKDGRKSK